MVGGVNNAPRLTRPAIRREAEHYRASGADLIDIGCTPGRVFAELADVVRELVALGMRVSIDSFDPGEIRTAVAAGAPLVVLAKPAKLAVARDLGGTGSRRVGDPRARPGDHTDPPAQPPPAHDAGA